MLPPPRSWIKNSTSNAVQQTLASCTHAMQCGFFAPFRYILSLLQAVPSRGAKCHGSVRSSRFHRVTNVKDEFTRPYTAPEQGRAHPFPNPYLDCQNKSTNSPLNSQEVSPKVSFQRLYSCDERHGQTGHAAHGGHWHT